MKSAPGTRLDPALVRLALILVVGALAPLLDSTIVNVALHTLAVELDASVATVQWIVTAYLLAMAVAVPVAAWTADRFGAKRMWLVALTLFLAGSLLCAAAWNVGSLIAFRVVQGVGGGLMLPILQTVLLRAAAGRNIGRLMSVVTLPALIGPILGPVLGGLITGHLHWRWLFLVNLPVCLLALLLAWRGVPDDRIEGGARLDLIGLALASPGLAAVLYGLSHAHDGLDSPAVFVSLIVGAVLLGGFVYRALHIDEPLIDLRLFADRSFAAASALMFLLGSAMFAALLLLPLFYLQVRGASVVATGLLLAPQGLGSLLARGAGGLADRYGPRPVVMAGISLTAIGTMAFAFVGHSGGDVVLAVSLVVRGIGLSAANMAVMVGAYQGLNRRQIPHASATTRIMQQLGGSFGAAGLAVLLQHELGRSTTAVAYHHTFWWAIALTAVAVIPAMLLPRATPQTRT